MSQKTTPSWNKLHSLQPYLIQYLWFATLFDRKCKSLVFIPQTIRPIKKIYKYSFLMKSLQTCQIQHEILYPITINKNKIYTICGKNKLKIIEIFNDNCKIEYLKNLYAVNKFKDPHSSFIIIQKQMYCITDSHFIKYNIKTKKHQILPNSSIRNWFGASLTQVKNNLILFGRIDHKTPSIQQYDISNNCWEILPVKLSTEINFISTTSILNEQMILILATDIDLCFFIYEVKTQIFKKLNIKLPKYIRMCNQIFAMNDKKRDISIVNGWIKNEYQNRYIPVCLKEIIHHYYINESIHATSKIGDLYQIDVFDILNNWQIK